VETSAAVYLNSAEPAQLFIRGRNLNGTNASYYAASVMRGAEERLAPILMTALTAGLALVPLAISGEKPGHEIEHPLAVVILGGLVTSTVLNLFLLPSFYAVFGRVRKVDPGLVG